MMALLTSPDWDGTQRGDKTPSKNIASPSSTFRYTATMNSGSQYFRTTRMEDAKSSPALRARWLGRQLREARERAGLTLKDVRAHLLRDTGTISRFENGRLPPRPADVGALLTLYRVEDPAKREALDQLSRDVWSKGWWDAYTGRLSPDSVDLAWLENRAHAIRSYDSGVPDLLQTEDFARTVIQAADPDSPPDRVRTSMEFHTRRRRLLDRKEPPEFTAILDESILLKPIGGPSVMRDQLRHLLELAARPNLTVRVLPLKSAAQAACTGAFQIFTLPEPYTEVAHAETLAGSVVIESSAVSRFTASYNRMLTAALSSEQSAALIETAANGLR